ncbi:MAG: acyclic terpene utilization AtuA family protein [Pseudomonadota bacterium]
MTEAKTVHIGCGAGFMGDRFDACLPILRDMERRVGPKYLMFEVLAERTLAVAQNVRRSDPDKGYSPYLDHYITRALAPAKAGGVTIVSNMGAANPVGAAKRVLEIAAEQGIEGLTVATVSGDDLLAHIPAAEIAAMDTMEGIGFEGRPIVAANAYLGARPVADAIATDADVVLVGRTTDSALALGPLIHEFGWTAEQLDLLAQGTTAGHLLECGGQITGCYFADPGFKDVPGLSSAGFPIAECHPDGSFTITKPAGTGGLVNRQTVTEQLLYEMHDPGAYLVPDVTLDCTGLQAEEIGKDRVRISGARGHTPPPSLKATVSVDGGWLGEAFMTYSGPNALARADLAGQIIGDRLASHGLNEPVRIETLGTGVTLDGGSSEKRATRNLPGDGEYTVRIATQSVSKDKAQMICDELMMLYCSGPAGGGGYRGSVTSQIATASVLIPRERIEPHVRIEVHE